MEARKDLDADGWSISGVRSAERFFRAVPVLVPDVTRLYLEGAPGPHILTIIADYVEQIPYDGPKGTLWSWPRRNRRFTLRASSSLFADLSDAAAHHAVPEICFHLHLYRKEEPLLQWFDAFDLPLWVSRSVPRERIERFCLETQGKLDDAAA
jgi:hypothetical protein